MESPQVSQVLVVANETATSARLLNELEGRAASRPCRVHAAGPGRPRPGGGRAEAGGRRRASAAFPVEPCSARPVELGRDGAHVRLERGEQLADPGRQPRPRAGDDREGVVERRLEGRGRQRRGEVRHARVRARQVGVAEPGGDELQRDVDQLDLHARSQADAERLGALGELAADRVVVGRLGVVEDERRRGEPLDRGRPVRPPGVGADVEDLVAHERAHVEAVAVDRRQQEPRLELAAADAAHDRRGVAADQPDGESGVVAQERRRELLEAPGERPAEDADRDRAAVQRGELADAARCVLERAQAARRGLGEHTARLRRDDAAAGADEQVGAEQQLELADLLGDGRLRDAQRARGGGERAELERCAETADLLERHKLSLRFHQGINPTLGRCERGQSPRMTRDVVVIGGGIAGLSAAWHLRHRDVMLLEAGDRLGGRIRSEARGRYWLNTGAHLFPAPGTLLDGIARECGLETVPVWGGMMGLAVGSTILDSGRVETYPLRLPLAPRDRVAFALAGLKIQRAVARYHRLERRFEFEDHRTFGEFLGPLPHAVREILSCAAHRATGELDEISAGCGIGLFALVWGGKGSLIARNVVGGTGQLPAAIGRKLGDRARTGSRVDAIEPDGDELVVRCGGEEIRARQVIVAAQAPFAAPLVAPVAEAAADALARLTYGPFVAVALETSEPGPMPYDGLYAMA